MARLFGRNYTRRGLLSKLGHISQVAGTRPYQLTEGNQNGVRAIDVDTGSGFRFTVLPDRGMDISAASHNGRSLCWRSATGEVAPAFYEQDGLGWLRSFYGGLLTTCGMTYMGAPCTDLGEKLGLHGRISNIPARNIIHGGHWEGDEYSMFVRGQVTETSVFGVNLALARRITTVLGEDHLRIHDCVENNGFEPAPLMMLYHINLGFPVLDETSQLISPTIEARPRDAEAEEGKADYAKYQAPAAGYAEKCYYHDMKPDNDGNVGAAIVNREFGNGRGIGVYVKYLKSELPKFTQWKMMGQGTYVTGIEPGTNNPDGRAEARAKGTLRSIDPGEKVEFHLEIGVLTGTEAIDEFEETITGGSRKRK